MYIPCYPFLLRSVKIKIGTNFIRKIYAIIKV